MIYDCMMIHSELSALRLHINRHPHVDRFIVVEGIYNYDGTPKEPVVSKHAKDFPEVQIILNIQRFPTKAQQRELLAQALTDASASDLVAFSNVREWWKPEDPAVLRLALEMPVSFGAGENFHAGTPLASWGYVEEVGFHRFRNDRERYLRVRGGHRLI